MASIMDILGPPPEGFDPSSLPPTQIPVRYMNYGPVANEYGHSQMYGPNENALTPEDIAVSPNIRDQYDLPLGTVVRDAEGNIHTVGDWSYYHPDQPTYNTVEMRDRLASGQGSISKVSVGDLLGPPPAGQPGTGVQQVLGPPPTNLPPEDQQLTDILHRHMQEALQSKAITPQQAAASELQGYAPEALGPRTTQAVSQGRIPLDVAIQQTQQGYGAPSPAPPQPGLLEGAMNAGAAINESLDPEWNKRLRESFQKPLYNPEQLVAGQSIDQATGKPLGALDAALSNLGRGALSFMSSPKGVLETLLPELFIAEGLHNIPSAIEAVQQAEQTPPFSQQRYEAGLNVLTTLMMGKGGAHSLMKLGAPEAFNAELGRAIRETPPEAAPAPVAPPPPPAPTAAQQAIRSLPEELPQGRVSPETGQVFPTGPVQRPVGETAQFVRPELNIETDRVDATTVKKALDKIGVPYTAAPLADGGPAGVHVVLERPLTEEQGQQLLRATKQTAIPQKLGPGQYDGNMFIQPDQVDLAKQEGWGSYDGTYFRGRQEAPTAPPAAPAAVPAATTPAAPEATGASLQRAYTEPRLQAEGGQPETFKTGLPTAKYDPVAAQNLVDRVMAKPQALSPEEGSVVLQHIDNLEQQKAKLVDEINNGNAAPTAAEDLTVARANLIDAYTVARRMGNQRGLALRQMQEFTNNLSPERMKAEALAANKGQPISPQTAKAIDTLHKTMVDSLEKAQKPALEPFQPKTVEAVDATLKQKAMEAAKRLNIECE